MIEGLPAGPAARLPLEVLETEWTAALDDAAMPRERVRLYVCDGGAAGDGATAAVWHRPGAELVQDHQFPYSHHLADANAREHRDLHRVVIWRDHEAPMLGAVMRHELEHARQWDARGAPLFDLHDLIEHGVLPHK